MCGHYYLFDIDPSLSGWYEARRKIGMDMDEVAYDCWLGALDAFHPGHDFRRFGLSDLELSDDDLLGRLLSTVLFDDGGCRFIRSVVAVVNGYRAHRG